jgi:DNA-binding CsgD family transcriptional regulator/ribosomal protein L24E
MLSDTTKPDRAMSDFWVKHCENLCTALVSEPGTGVMVVSGDGRWRFMNTQAAEMHFGPGAEPSQYIGRKWSDVMPEEWVQDRLNLHRKMLEKPERPVLLRVIWRGRQHLSWIRCIAKDFDADAGEPDLFLIISRLTSNDGSAEDFSGSTAFEMIDSSVVNLGRLDVLSPRELEVTALLGQGLSVKEIAAVLHRSEKTVDHHRVSIYEKLKVHDRVALADIARAAGLRVEDAGRTRV